jgi:glycine/D-amino acid oxidase-like deaminating enzyme
MPDSADVTVIGGGLVGASIAYGLARTGASVIVLDEGDTAFRASRGNFALVWVQSKGMGMPEYSAWSKRSADGWHGLAQSLREDAEIDVSYSQPGGFSLGLSDREMQGRIDGMRRLHNRAGPDSVPYEVLDRAETKRRLPGIGPTVVGSIYSPCDGHANSLKLFRALHVGLTRHKVDYRPMQVVDSIEYQNGGFVVRGSWGSITSGKIVLAAGLGNARLGPMVGLTVPVRPSKGQVIVTEKAERFLDNPFAALRQTDEGGVMIGDSQEELGFNTVVTTPILSVMAERAVRMFPRIAELNVVRTWSALRVMTSDGFPLYDQSVTCPGAFVVTCHSGVTLAANHVQTIAPAIAAGRLPEFVQPFSAERFHVPAGV